MKESKADEIQTTAGEVRVHMSTIARLSLAQYDRMIESGVFDEERDRRIELIHGELREMNPIGLTHEDAVDSLVDWSIECDVRGRARLRIQASIGIPALDSAPQSDVVWAAKRSYRKLRPQGDNILLLIEVAESSLAYDRGEKAELYASGGIQDYWLVNLIDQQVEVLRKPEGGQYHDLAVFSPGQEVRPLKFPELALPVSRLFSDES